ncbi:MAG: primase-helicase family protein, partial [Bryobacteraceae bacterium]
HPNGRPVLNKGKPKVDAKGKKILDKLGKPKLEKGEPKFVPASVWLDKNAPVHQMTWTPAEKKLIYDKVVVDAGWADQPGAVCLNLYQPPPVIAGSAGKAGPWLDHIRKVYPSDADHIVRWFAHRVQFPGDKINHALMFGGTQGIGKDSILEPVKQAVGAWNFGEVSPAGLMGRFNGHLKSVILRVSEARDLGDSNRFSMYDHMKTISAAPPDVHRVDEKNLREHYVINVCGVVITTNYLTDGIYLPANDRRTYVAWSEMAEGELTKEYFDKLHGWYRDEGGNGQVAAYLSKLDLSSFDAKAPPPKTAAFWRIVDANRSPEEGELADAIEKLNSPAALTLDQVVAKADESLSNWLEDRKNRRAIPHRLELVGYIPVRNSGTVGSDGGLWRIASVKNG